jgi:polysaccharide biosynthesis/export protein
MQIERKIGRWRFLWILALAAMLGGCLTFERNRGGERFVWVELLEESDGDPHAFRLQPGDTIRVDVWKQNDLSGNLRVRSDGRITVPLVGDVLVAGLTPQEASAVVSEALVQVVRNPTVVIGVVEVRPIQVGVLGEVQNPGMYQLDRGSGVLHAIAMAGGLTEYADPQRIFVIRGGPFAESEAPPIRFSYRMLIQSRGRAAQFVLSPGDIVVVE